MFFRFGGYTVKHSSGSYAGAYGLGVSFVEEGVSDTYYDEFILVHNTDTIYYRSATIANNGTLDWSTINWKTVTSV